MTRFLEARESVNGITPYTNDAVPQSSIATLTDIAVSDGSPFVTPLERSTLCAVGAPSARDGFDYRAFDAPVADELREVAARIRDYDHRAKAAIIEIGLALLKAKERLGHGHWSAWLDAEFRWSGSTAERYMRVARRFSDKIGTVTILPARMLYLLSGKSTPTQTVDEIVADLEAGKALSDKQIRERVETAKRIAIPDKNQPAPRSRRHDESEPDQRDEPDGRTEHAAEAAATAAVANILIDCLGLRRGEFLRLFAKADLHKVIDLLHRSMMIDELAVGAATAADSGNGHDEPPLPFTDPASNEFARRVLGE